jgi:hypothetical protein
MSSGPGPTVILSVLVIELSGILWHWWVKSKKRGITRSGNGIFIAEELKAINVTIKWGWSSNQSGNPFILSVEQRFRIMRRFYLLMIISLLLSCEADMAEPEALGENRGVIGTWIAGQYEDDLLWLNRVQSLDPSKYGFTIGDDGSFIERKNAGWCATPPIYYDNFEGTWVALSDSLLEVTVGYWGGTMNYQIRIVTVDQDMLAIRYLYGEDRASSK